MYAELLNDIVFMHNRYWLNNMHFVNLLLIKKIKEFFLRHGQVWQKSPKNTAFLNVQKTKEQKSYLSYKWVVKKFYEDINMCCHGIFRAGQNVYGQISHLMSRLGLCVF